MRTVGRFLLIAAISVGCGSGDETANYEVPVTLEDPNPPPELAFAGLPDDLTVDESVCPSLSELVEPLPLESTPERVLEIADRYESVGEADERLEVAGAAAANGLRAAAAGGADLAAMFAIWDDTPTRSALWDLAMLAFDTCDVPLPDLPLGPPDRLVDVAQHLFPDADLIDPIKSWSMSITGDPPTIYWSYGYLGDDPIGTCGLLEQTLVALGYSGTFLTVHDGGTGDTGEIIDLAEAKAGDGCFRSRTEGS